MKAGILTCAPGHRLAALLAAVLVCHAAAAQTTNDWLLAGSGNWTNEANWRSSAIPDSNTEVAGFTNEYLANFTVTQDVSLAINGIIFDDTGGGTDVTMTLNRTGSSTLTFDGANPFIDSRSTAGGGPGITINTPIILGAAGLTKVGGGVATLASTLSGSSTVTVSVGTIEVKGNNAGFTGAFVVNNGTTLDIRSADANALGSTNVGTIVNGSGQLRFRDLGSRTFSEPITVNGFNNHGSIKCYASSNVVLNGPVLLNTNGVLALEQWLVPIDPGRKQDWYVDSVISDDGSGRGVHFLNDFQSNNSTGALSRTSEIVLGGAATYGGYTHITAGGPFAGTVRMTNGNNRLPTSTRLILGGVMNSVGISSGNGRFVLNGYSQELAGLTTLGSGVSNRVAGGSPTLSTLVLNIGAGTTNVFGGLIGGTGPNENNLALVSKGPGILDLTGANTYTGATTITNGTLRVNGSHFGGGGYAIQSGGILGGTGLIDAAIHAAAGGIIAPGNSIGTLTVSNSVDLDGTLQIELRNAAGPGGGFSDLMDVNGFFDITNGTIQFVLSETLTNAFYVFAEYDALSGESFSAIPNLPVGYEIDYNYLGLNRIALVIPEPSAWGLMVMGLALAARLVARGRRGGRSE